MPNAHSYATARVVSENGHFHCPLSDSRAHTHTDAVMIVTLSRCQEGGLATSDELQATSCE
ncbi:MAG: hypothetical protein MR319_05165 [Mediterranea sp.]|nr:hypothetical protein [Mediterranea sp.]